MYGIFIHHLYRQGTYRIKELQLVFFSDPGPTDENLRHEVKRCVQTMEDRVRTFSCRFLPPGSGSREKWGRMYTTMKGLSPFNSSRPSRDR
jgi:hypothetical protein